MCVNGLYIVPVSFSLALDLHRGAVFSGLLVSCCTVLTSVSSLLGMWVLKSYPEWVRVHVCSAPLQYVAALVVFGLASRPPAALPLSEVQRVWALLASRLLLGVGDGTAMQYKMLLSRVAAPDEQVTLSLWHVMGCAAGYGFGPFVSSATSYAFQVVSAPDTARCSSFVLGVVWTAVFVIMLCVVPHDWDPLHFSRDARRENGLPSPHESKALDAAEKTSGLTSSATVDAKAEVCAARRSLCLAALIYSFERTFTSSALEVSTALVLETDYGLTHREIGILLGIAFTCAAPFLFLIWHARRASWISELGLAMSCQLFCVAASLVFFKDVAHELVGHGRDPNVVALLFVDFTLFSAGYAVSGIMMGHGAKYAMPGTMLSIESMHVLSMVLGQTLARGMGPVVGRAIIIGYGRNYYALLQLFLTSLGVHQVHRAGKAMAVIEGAVA